MGDMGDKMQDSVGLRESVAQRLVEPRDEGSLAEPRDVAHREAIRCTLAAYRRPDRLEVGDPVPGLELTVLTDLEPPGSDTVDIAAAYDRPVMLIFGSYT